MEQPGEAQDKPIEQQFEAEAKDVEVVQRDPAVSVSAGKIDRLFQQGQMRQAK
jgi:hypothetical protein